MRIKILLLLAFIGFASADHHEMDWTQTLHLDHGFTVSWMMDNPDTMTMEISAPTRGWVAIGFSPSGAMAGSDIIMGWMDRQGRGHVKDLYAVGNSAPLIDDVNNVVLLDARRDGEMLNIRFKREWNTCDRDHDYKIGNDTIRLIWAFGDEIPSNNPNSWAPKYHGATYRGQRHAYLRVPPKHLVFPEDDPKIKQFDMKLTNQYVHDRDSTVYYCAMMKFPEVKKKHQIIGWRPIIQQENIQRVHHYVVYECAVPKGSKSADMFEKDLGKVFECYEPNMPNYWTTYCMTVPLVWTIGSEGEMFAPDVGLPIGEDHGGSTYFMFEAHYDNPEKKAFYDSSGLRTYYTEDVRENDFQIIFVGHSFSRFQFIPPGASNYHFMGGCSSECTENAFPPEGILVTNVLMHAHTHAHKITLHHIRDGVELAPIAQDHNYDINYQQARPVDPPVRVLPGDVLLTSCEFDASKYKKPLYIGLTTNTSEMCHSFLQVYPRVPLAMCQMQLEFNDFMNGVAGVSKVEGDVLKILNLPYKPAPAQKLDPPDEIILLLEKGHPLAVNSMDMMKVGDKGINKGKSIEEMLANRKWTKESIRDVEKIYKNGHYYHWCTEPGRVRIPLKNYVTKIPKFKRYQDHDSKCGVEHLVGEEWGGAEDSSVVIKATALPFVTLAVVLVKLIGWN